MQADMSILDMMSEILARIDTKLKTKSLATLAATSDTKVWTLTVHKKVYRDIRGRCLQNGFNWPNIVRFELYEYAKELHAKGHMFNAPSKP